MKNESRVTDASAFNNASARRIPVRSISLSIIGVVTLYVGMVTIADWKTLVDAVSSLSGLLWVQVGGLSLLSYLFRFTRWHHFIVALGYKMPIFPNLEIYVAAFALTLTPGKAGETIRSVYLRSYGVSYSHSIGAFVSERLLDLAVVGALASLTVSIFPGQLLWMFAAICCIAIVILLLRSRLLFLNGVQSAECSAVSHATNLVSTVRFLLTSRQVAAATLLTLIAWVAQGISLYLIVHELGYELTSITVVAIYCLSILAGAVSLIPGGVGTTEAAIVLLLSAMGVRQSDAITASLICRTLTLWLAVGIGVTAMIRISLIRCRSEV